MALYLNKDASKITERAQRNQFTKNAELQKNSESDFSKLLTNAGISPGEAYREMEDKTTIILNPAGEFATYQRVSGKSKSVNIGKLDYTYRQSSAQTGGKISMSGQTGIITDAVEYKNAGTVIPIMDHGTKRDWREYETFGADGFDTMIDDTREANLVVLRVANNYLWNGDATIKSPDGRTWLGLRNDPSVVQATTGIDLRNPANTAQAIVTEVVRLRDILRITNNCSQLVEIAIPRETLSYWEATPYSVNEAGFGTILSYIRGLTGVASVYEEPELSTGYEVTMAYIDLDGLHAVTGQAMSTYMAQRFAHNDPYAMVKWLAQGFVSKNTFTSQKCALYSKQ